MGLLACAASALGSGIAIHYANASQDRQQAAYRVDQENRQTQARRALEQKFSQALSISNRQNAYSINKSVCGFRGLVGPTLRSYEAAAKDESLSESARARNDKRILTTREFLDSQVTVPPDFDCKNLPKKQPTP
jgi:hypothetical protein